MAFRHHADVEVAAFGRVADGAVQVQFRRRALARELTQAAQRDLDVAGAEFQGVVQVLELALIPHLHCAEVAVVVLADAHPFGVVAVGAEGRRAGGADPLRSPLVALLLLLQALFQRLHQLVPAAQGLDLRPFLGRQGTFSQFAQPVLGDVLDINLFRLFQPLEHMAEHPVELVQVLFILHQGGAGQIVEMLDAVVGQSGVHAVQQGQVFPQGYGQLG